MTVKEELIQIIDKMPEENISRVIELIKSNEYLDEALEMENKGKLYILIYKRFIKIFKIRTNYAKRI